MRRVRYSVAMSLDGYIADPKGGYDWIVMDPEMDFGAMFKQYDTVLMGRKSYDMARAQGGGGETGKMKTYVFSHTLLQEDCPDVTVSHDPKRTVAELKRQTGKDIWLFGGGELFRSLLELRLVDAVQVGLVPVLLGGGLPMLPNPATLAKLKLTSHHVYPKTGTILLDYSVRQ